MRIFENILMQKIIDSSHHHFVLLYCEDLDVAYTPIGFNMPLDKIVNESSRL